jgi:hypothetical protein
MTFDVLVIGLLLIGVALLGLFWFLASTEL